ncbi:hypothetical protein RJI07_00100 [Mycoplasmatota bacterium WC30]
MYSLIERYVYDVVRRLPEKSRTEVAKELRANISDMLSDTPTKNEIENVLESLGHPRKLANNYREKQRYLIGPEWMDDYLMALKIVLVVFGGIALVVAVVTNILNPDSTTIFGIIFEVIGKSLSEVGGALLKGFALVTIVFVIREKYNLKLKVVEFDVRNLPDLPDSKARNISKFSVTLSLILNIVFGFLFIYLLYNNKLYIGWFDASNNFNIIAPFFNNDVALRLIPLLIFSILLNVGADIFALIEKQWTVKLTIVTTITKFTTALITIIFINQQGLVSSEFINVAAGYFDMTIQNTTDGINTIILVISILTGLGALANIGSTWNQTLKFRSKSI